MICGDAQLAALDREYAAAYRKALDAAPDKAKFRRESVEAWKQRQSTCTDKPCLLGWYAARKAVFAQIIGGGRDTSSDASAASAALTPARAAQPASAAPIDLNNAAALDDKYDIDATVFCASDADDYLRSISKYSFKWDDIGFFDVKFDRYLKKVASPGVLVLATNKVSLQNGFGAYQRIDLYCEFDTQKRKVVRYWVEGVE